MRTLVRPRSGSFRTARGSSTRDRSPEEFSVGHIEGAVNVPVDTIDAADLGPKENGVVVYCASGRRAARVASTLRAKGYTHVYELGAMSNWPK